MNGRTLAQTDRKANETASLSSQTAARRALRSVPVGELGTRWVRQHQQRTISDCALLPAHLRSNLNLPGRG